MQTINTTVGAIEHRDVPIDKVIIPDLFHIIQRLIKSDRQSDRDAAQAIMDTWHLAHNMKDTLISLNN